jgi:multidrug resistance protein
MMGHGIISPILPLFAKSFGVGAAVAGLTISIFGAARLIMNLPAGFLSDRFGRRILLVGGPAVAALGGLTSGLAPDIWSLLAFRFLAGAGSAMYMTGAMIYLVDVTTEENRGRIMSIYQGSILLGVSVGPAVGGGIAEVAGIRAPFYLVAVLAGLATVWSFLRMPETARPRPPATDAALPTAAEPSAGATPAPMGTMAAVRYLLSRPDFLLVSMLTMSIFLTRTGGRLTLLPLIGEERIGLGFGSLGAIFAMMTILNLMVLMPAGTMIDRLGRKAVIVPSALVTGFALVLFALSGNVMVFVLAGVVHGIGTGIVGPAPAAYAADIAPEGMRGITMGLFRTFGDLGFVIGPVMLGSLADVAGFTFALIFNSIILVSFAVLFALFARETYSARAGSEPAPVRSPGST